MKTLIPTFILIIISMLVFSGCRVTIKRNIGYDKAMENMYDPIIDWQDAPEPTRKLEANLIH